MTALSDVLEFLIAKNIAFQKVLQLNHWWYSTLYRVKTLTGDERKARIRRTEIVFRNGRCVWGLFILALTITGVEKIIIYNALSAQNDISKPGQIIPLILGVITFMEGAASALMPEPLPLPRRESTVVAVANEGQIPLNRLRSYEEGFEGVKPV